MEITYVVIVFIITYIFGAINKACFREIPNRFIPLQNVIIGIISGIVCYFTKVEPNLLQAIVLCFMAAIGAGGTADLKNVIKGGDNYE